MKKIRLDQLMHQRGMVESRSQAQKLIMAGEVDVSGQRAVHVSDLVDPGIEITLHTKAKYVSRGGEKLQAALVAFKFTDLNNLVCADVGASTGGFTDCLLQHGACRVYAIDVGHGELHWKLRNDPRVIVLEKTNARYLDNLPEKIDLVVIDASFISLKNLIPVVQKWQQESSKGIIALIKPQFEAGRTEAAKSKGVIRDPAVHEQVLHNILGFASDCGFGIHGLIRSPLLGPKGNIEFLTWFKRLSLQMQDLESLIHSALPISSGEVQTSPKVK